MKFDEIEAGRIYAYYEGRDLRYASFSAHLVLAAAKYAREYRSGGEIKLAGPGARMGVYHYYSSIGIPSIRLRASALDRLGEIPQDALAKFREGGHVTAANGDVLGEYKLVLNSGYLHGGYAERKAEQAATEKANEAARQVAKARQEAAQARYAELEARAEALGVSRYHEYQSEPNHMSFSFAGLERLLELAEKGAQR